MTWQSWRQFLKRSSHETGSKKLIQMDPVQKSDLIGLLFTRDLTGTGPEWIQTDPKPDLLFDRSNFGSLWIRSGHVPERARVNRSRSGPVRSGSVRNGSGPVPCKL